MVVVLVVLLLVVLVEGRGGGGGGGRGMFVHRVSPWWATVNALPCALVDCRHGVSAPTHACCVGGTSARNERAQNKRPTTVRARERRQHLVDC
jgi:hypothetical protein